jgi:hypothetical protein
MGHTKSLALTIALLGATLAGCGGGDGASAGPDTTTMAGACEALDASGSLKTIEVTYPKLYDSRYDEDLRATMRSAIDDVTSTTADAPAPLRDTVEALDADFQAMEAFIDEEVEGYRPSAITQWIDELATYCS